MLTISSCVFRGVVLSVCIFRLKLFVIDMFYCSGLVCCSVLCFFTFRARSSCKFFSLDSAIFSAKLLSEFLF